jgi:hypothetical protein
MCNPGSIVSMEAAIFPNACPGSGPDGDVLRSTSVTHFAQLSTAEIAAVHRDRSALSEGGVPDVLLYVAFCGRA